MMDGKIIERVTGVDCGKGPGPCFVVRWQGISTFSTNRSQRAMSTEDAIEEMWEMFRMADKVFAPAES